MFALQTWVYWDKCSFTHFPTGVLYILGVCTLYTKGHFWEKYEWGELLFCLGHLAFRYGPRQSTFFLQWIYEGNLLAQAFRHWTNSGTTSEKASGIIWAESEITRRRLSLSSCKCGPGRWLASGCCCEVTRTDPHCDPYPRNAPLSPPPPPAPRSRRHQQGKVVVWSQIRSRTTPSPSPLPSPPLHIISHLMHQQLNIMWHRVH